jgi:anti-sigma factor RsiW
MNFPISPDDPQLTAFALGELEGDERAAVEAALRRDPALRTTVDEIRGAAAQLEAALAAETELDETPDAVLAGQAVDRGAAAPRKSAAAYRGPRYNGAHVHRSVGTRLFSFPTIYYLVGGLAAAGFAIMALQYDESAHRLPAGPIAAKPVLPSAIATTDEAPPAGVEVTRTPSAPVAVTPPAPTAAEVVVTFPAETAPPKIAPPSVASLPEPAANSDSDAAAPTGPMLAGNLSLLEQAREPEITLKETDVIFGPLPAPTALLSLNPSFSPAAPGRPWSAPFLKLPAANTAAPTESHPSSAAMVRPPGEIDPRRLAELRAAGSPAELARYLAEVQRADRKAKDAAQRFAVRPSPSPANEVVQLEPFTVTEQRGFRNWFTNLMDRIKRIFRRAPPPASTAPAKAPPAPQSAAPAAAPGK